MKVIKVSDEVHARLVEGAEGSIGSYIEELLDKPTNDVYPEYVKDLFSRIDKLVTVLEKTPAGGVSEKENPSPQKTSGLKPVRNKHVVNAELFAVRGEKRNILQTVQDKARDEYWTDEESLSYAHQLEVELDEKEQRLVDELNGLEG